MATEVKVEVIGRETIKPSSPTPDHLSTYELCLLDQFAPVMYIPVILFYDNPLANGGVVDDDGDYVAEKTLHLKKTLSQTLTHFYPLAGRITSTTFHSVDCNDAGTEFATAKINCPLSKFLKKPDMELFRQLVAVDVESSELPKTGPLLVVQITFFECGGMAVGVVTSHKFMDVASLITFLKSWTATALGSEDEAAVPKLGCASLLPTIEHPPPIEIPRAKSKSIRFVFEAEKIEALRHKAAGEMGKYPTRVEAVSALIWKSAMEAFRSCNKNSLPAFVFNQVLNVRARTVPCLPENIVGNLIRAFPTMWEQSDADDLQLLVLKLKRSIEQVKAFYAEGLDAGRICQELDGFFREMARSQGAVVMYHSSSWCRFPFYEVEFGWGKPTWVSTCDMKVKNSILLMDTRDGNGIEVSLNLAEEEMGFLESNQELLAFASLNPSVV